MDCMNHPGTSASAICTRCDKTICDACCQERNGKPFCADCAQFLDQRQAQRPGGAARPQTVSVPVPPAPAPSPPATSGGGRVFRDDPPAQPPPQSQAASDSVFADTPPATPSQGVFAETPSQAEGDVYGGSGDVYEGPGDVYQGPGDVYQGPTAGAAAGMAASSAAAGSGSGGSGGDFILIRALIFGGFAAVLAVFIWYQVAVHTGKEFGFVALLVGAMVGIGCRLGAGASDERVGLFAVAVFVLSMVVGEFLITKYFLEGIFDDPEMVEEMALDIEYDCDFTNDEARRLIGFEESEWDGLDATEQRQWVRMLEAQCEDENYGYDEEYSSTADYEPAEPEPFTFGEFLGGMFGYFGFMGLVFLAIGSAEAYKLASAGADE